MPQMLKSKKKIVLIIASVSLTAVLVLCAFTGGSNTQQQGETVYRENTVTRGDLTVGVTESTTATLKVHDIYFDFTLSSSSSSSGGNSQNSNTSIEIEEIYVKAGQSVKKGDPLVLLSSSDIQEAINEYQSDYQEASVALTAAQLSLQKGKLEAKNTYESTLLDSQNADETYDMTLEQLELAVTKSQREVENLKKEISTYTVLLHYMDEDTTTGYWDYVNTREWLSSCKLRVSLHKGLLSDYVNSADYEENSSEHQRLLYNLEEAQDELYYAELEYEEIGNTNMYEDAYETELTEENDIEDARETAREKLETAQSSLKQAQYNLKLKSAGAELDKDKTLSQGEIAESTYQLQIAQLENTVASKELAASNIQDSITKLQGYLEQTTLTAPCDGLVTQVNYSAGDSVSSGTTILSVSDADNVYVYVSVAQDDILGITMGQSATLTLDAFDTLAFDGVVDSISTTPARSASGSASYNVTIQVLGDTSQVYEGMTGSATLITRQQKDVIYVSTRTIYQKDDQSYVKVKQEDGSIEEVPVTIGFSDGRNVEITSGLTEGQTVLIESQVTAQT